MANHRGDQLASDLDRFVQAQDPVFQRVCEELAAGRKTSHWMWFIFPQLGALGRSTAAKHFGFTGRQEARAYLDHRVLGPRLVQCARLVLTVRGLSAAAIFGFPDDVKLRSRMTLFEAVGSEEAAFGQVLSRFFDGQRDERTLELLG